MATFDIGGVSEEVVTRDEFPLAHALDALCDEVIAVIGYGTIGSAQSLNLRDNGVRVIVGQRRDSVSWERAVADGWVEGKTLFSLEEGVNRGSIISYVLSDAGQKMAWPLVRERLTNGKALCFAHGFSIVYSDQTGVVPPENVDVFLIAPKGAGRTMRENFLVGHGINASVAVWQDASGKARERMLAMGVAMGSFALFPTTFEHEVYGDLTGERGVLVGGIYALMEAQYRVLRKHGHTPEEAFHESVEEATESLFRLIGEHGMDWMLAHCSTTAQRGALDWRHRFRSALEPVFEELYGRVKDGTETRIVLEANSDPQYRKKLADELDAIAKDEMWQAGKVIRSLRAHTPPNNHE